MCGICGILSFKKPINTEQLLRMTRIMSHRGPDDEGFVLGNLYNEKLKSYHHNETIPEITKKTQKLPEESDANLGFGFRRLAILDLSDRGHQPMSFEEGNLIIVFNGEIYNFIELRDELKSHGYNFKSNTDTEVILKAYHFWGENCVKHFNGMWAFALWDGNEKKLFCSRDRFGIKPFYYHLDDEGFVFASEIKSILQYFETQPDYDVIFHSLIYGYTDFDEHTFFKNIKQLPGGHNLIIKKEKLTVYRYYHFHPERTEDNFEKAREKFRDLLFDAVKIRLRSDVPLGYSLSGGVDSSSIVGIASKINHGSNNTFSMIYPGDSLDESFYIRKVIEKTGVQHYFISPTPEDFLKDLDRFVWHLEEPFVGTSYYGEFKLRQLIRQIGVTVSLEGQGADEIISGYSSLIQPYLFDLINTGRLKNFVIESRNFKTVIEGLWPLLKEFLKQKFFPKQNANPELLAKKYPYMKWHNTNIINLVNTVKQLNYKTNSYLNNQLFEMLFYTSIPQLLVKADKTAMAFSVESRFPFLDYRLVEFAFTLPYYYKIHNGTTKYILREAVKDLLPEEVYQRKDKIGFAIPMNCFDNQKIRKILFEELSDINLDELSFIDKPLFLKYYFYDENYLDWKFWKVYSLIKWYDLVFNKQF